MTLWPFAGLQPMHYGVILADPPWQFQLFSDKGEGRSPQAHYDCMALADIKALPVAHLAAQDCALVMWATAPMLDVQIEVVRAWGFKFKTAGAWAKQSSTGRGWAFGGGYLYRSAAEFYILATIGRPERQSRSVRNLIVAPVREHSRKPDAMHSDLECLFPGPRCELFARQQRPGWDVWGNQTNKFTTIKSEVA